MKEKKETVSVHCFNIQDIVFTYFLTHKRVLNLDRRRIKLELFLLKMRDVQNI